MENRKMKPKRPRKKKPALPPLRLVVPEIEHRDPIEQLDRRFWPVSKPIPNHYLRCQAPCPECRRVLCDDGGRSTVMARIGDFVAYFRCRVCGHRWKLAVK